MQARTPLQAALRRACPSCGQPVRSQVWLAERIGKHESQVSRYVNGLIPDDATKLTIAEALGETVQSLWPEHELSQAA